MEWNKVNLRKKEKNLPEKGKRVCWATNENSTSPNVFHKFFGVLSNDEKYVDNGLKRYKLTSNYWWMDIENPH